MDNPLYLHRNKLPGKAIPKNEEAPAIGIDLGTTHSCVGIYQNDNVHVIANDHGNTTTSSYVAFTDTERLIGDAAKNQVAMNPSNTVFDIKRLIGRRFDDRCVQRDMKYWPFEVISDGGKPNIGVSYKGKSQSFYPEEILSMILEKMKSIAEEYLGKPVANAVVTVPAYFNNSQRQATKNAASVAGLNLLGIVNEPTAAAITYSWKKKRSGERFLLIYDLGGGTFDVSILSIKYGMTTVIATTGNTHLGGEDFDNRMVDYFIQEFQYKHPTKDLKSDRRAIRQLKVACEKAKRTLSVNKLAQIEIDYLLEGIGFCSTITRSQFEELNEDLFRSTLELVKRVLRDARLDRKDIDDVVPVGGSTRIPKIQELLQEFFNGKEVNKSMNRDEAVVSGAAIQAAILNSQKSEYIKDVIPRCVGICIKGGLMSVFVRRNTTIPTKTTFNFTTTCDNQKCIIFQAYEGDGAISEDNTLLGNSQYMAVTPALAGVPVIIVTCKIDRDGIIHFSAAGTYNYNMAEFVYNDHLSDNELVNMMTNAKIYRGDDEEEKKRISAKISLENFAFKIKYEVEEEGVRGSISEEDKHALLKEIEETLEWLETNSSAEKEKYEEKQESLEFQWNSIRQKSCKSDSLMHPVTDLLSEVTETNDPDLFYAGRNQENRDNI